MTGIHVESSNIADKSGRRLSGSFWIGGTLFAIMTILALIGMFWSPASAFNTHIAERFSTPSLHHLMGTDEFGRDLLSRVIIALGAAYLTGLGAVAVGVVVGGVIGAAAGYVRGFVGDAFMRLMDATYAVPHIVLAMLLIVVLGSGELSVIVAIGVFYIPVFARITYSAVLEGSNTLYAASARMMGGRSAYVLRHHVAGYALPSLVVQATNSFSVAVQIAAALAFLGLGVSPSQPTLGGMLSTEATYLGVAPWMPFFPGGVLILLVLGTNTLADSFERSFGRHAG